MSFIPRDYQLKAHAMLIAAFRLLQTILVMMPTGTGKTKTMVSFMQKYPHYKYLTVVRQRDLVFQFAEAVKDFGIIHTLFMGSENFNSSVRNVIASIDTIDERDWFPFYEDSDDLVIFIDEADETVSDPYQRLFDKIKTRKGRTFIAGFTATAFDKPLTRFTHVVVPITNNQARDIKALVDFEYIIPKLIDMSGIRIEKGEFNSKDVEVKFNTPEMVKHNFEQWLRFGENRQTLVFTTCQEHAERFMNEVNNFYGTIMAEIITANISKADRERIYKDFRFGKLRFIVNIRIVTRGVDLPEIGCILDLALTNSQNMHIQKLGRGSRPNPIYKNCLIIDCANNNIVNGPFYDWPREVNLSKKQKKSKLITTAMHVCITCYRASLKNPITRACPYCGTTYVIKEEKLTKAQKIKLEMESASPDKIKQLKMISEFKQLLWRRTNLKSQYSINIDLQKNIKQTDSPRIRAQKDLIHKYGLEEVKKIAKTIGLGAK